MLSKYDKLQILRDYKTPRFKTVKYVGIELEFFSEFDYERLSDLFIEAGLESKVLIKDDGSIRPRRNHYPYEINILDTERNIIKTMRSVCAVLRATESKVNKSCGMHVHIDMRNRSKEKVFHNLISAQPLFYAINPQSRKTNTFCARINTKSYAQSKMRGSRYQGINPHAFDRYKTFEIRIHAGTTNFKKIKNWINLILTVVNRKAKIKRQPKSLNGFIKGFNIQPQLGNYIKQRLQLFEQKSERIQ